MLNYDLAEDLWSRAERALANPPRGIELPWWKMFSHYLGGMRPHEITLLCAPTGSGKTQMLGSISAQLCLQGIPHFVAPVETGDTDFLARVLSALEKKDLNDGEPVNPEYLKELRDKYSERVFKQCMYISSYDNRVEIHEMVTMLTHMNQNHGCKVALLDNLNFFLNVVSSQMEKAEMDSAIHEFVMLAKRIPMHIILVVHPRKTDGGKIMSEFDAKGSSTAVQECANFIAFNRPNEKDLEKENKYITDRELIFFKIRKRGMYARKPIWFQYTNGRYQELKS